MRILLCVSAVFIELASVAHAQSVTEVQSACKGDLVVPHDDGTYSFTTESWRRARANAQYYGRCVEVAPPTQKLLNSWMGVLPENSIARTGRPTIDGDEFLDIDTVNASAPLYYGNSDAMIDVAYLAHASEITASQSVEAPSLFDRIKDVLDQSGTVDILSFKQTSFLIEAKDDSSIADLTLSLRSTVEGTSLNYTTEYSLAIDSPDYADADLSLSFVSAGVTDALVGSTDFKVIKLRPGVNEVTFGQVGVQSTGFLRTQIKIFRSNETLLMSMPANVLVAGGSQ